MIIHRLIHILNKWLSIDAYIYWKYIQYMYRYDFFKSLKFIIRNHLILNKEILKLVSINIYFASSNCEKYYTYYDNIKYYIYWSFKVLYIFMYINSNMYHKILYILKFQSQNFWCQNPYIYLKRRSHLSKNSLLASYHLKHYLMLYTKWFMQ